MPQSKRERRWHCVCLDLLDVLSPISVLLVKVTCGVKLRLMECCVCQGRWDGRVNECVGWVCVLIMYFNKNNVK